MKPAVAMLLLLVAPCGFFTQLCAEDESKVELGKEVEEILASYEKNVSKELVKAQAEIAELRVDAVRDLEKELKDQTRKGNLKVALAIQEKIEELESINPVSNVFGNKAVEAKNTFGIVGSWLCENNDTYELRIFGKDGKFEFYQSNAKAHKGRLIDTSTYKIGETGLAEVKHRKNKKRVILHTVSADGHLIIKSGNQQYTGRRLKE